MQTENDQIDLMEQQKEQEFPMRMDFYWQAIAIYSLSLLAYAVVMGTFSEQQFVLDITDPIVDLLLFVTFVSTVWVSINSYLKRRIIVGKDYIIFRNRFRERVFDVSTIRSIVFLKEQLTGRTQSRIVKIFVVNRKRAFRLRLALYQQEEQLAASLQRLRQSHDEHGK